MSAKAPGQSGKPCAQRCVESLHISGIENAELCLRTIQDLLCNIPGADHQTARNGDEAFACFVFDDLQNESSGQSSKRDVLAYRCTGSQKHLAHRLRPATKAIPSPTGSGPLRLAAATTRSTTRRAPKLFAFGVYLTPDEQSGKDADRCGDPDPPVLRLDTEFIALHLPHVNPTLTNHLCLNAVHGAQPAHAISTPSASFRSNANAICTGHPFAKQRHHRNTNQCG